MAPSHEPPLALHGRAKFWMTTCIKAFTFIFSYMNFLPIPWRLSIFNEAFFGRPMMDDELKVGCDFYGRPTESLWFNLSRKDRRAITILLNVAWITHFASQVGHLVYWTHAEGQSLEGTLAQNVPFVMSILSGVAAGLVQGQAEKRARALQPDKFPPLFATWMEFALKDASDRWLAEASGFGRTVPDGTGSYKRDPRFEPPPAAEDGAGAVAEVAEDAGARGEALSARQRKRRRVLPLLCCCKWGSARFWSILLEEIREEHAINKAKLASYEDKAGKTHAFTGVSIGTPKPIDTTGDGVADSLAIDTTGDGKLDTIFKNPHMERRDNSGDGVAESFAVDSTGDDRLDTMVQAPNAATSPHLFTGAPPGTFARTATTSAMPTLAAAAAAAETAAGIASRATSRMSMSPVSAVSPQQASPHRSRVGM